MSAAGALRWRSRQKPRFLPAVYEVMSEKRPHERRRRPPLAQPAKTTLFAGGLRSNVRKTAAGRFSN
jgi:hypothetical protein